MLVDGATLMYDVVGLNWYAVPVALTSWSKPSLSCPDVSFATVVPAFSVPLKWSTTVLAAAAGRVAMASPAGISRARMQRRRFVTGFGALSSGRRSRRGGGS